MQVQPLLDLLIKLPPSITTVIEDWLPVLSRCVCVCVRVCVSECVCVRVCQHIQTNIFGASTDMRFCVFVCARALVSVCL